MIEWCFDVTDAHAPIDRPSSSTWSGASMKQELYIALGQRTEKIGQRRQRCLSDSEDGEQKEQRKYIFIESQETVIATLGWWLVSSKSESRDRNGIYGEIW